ncbi:MAG TPA: pitrilysin family protein [Candidatus Polarisedimenticolia bacterium]|nr:pitrilysin family protein [Candidatus Polarisedimenticolia bacterium]
MTLPAGPLLAAGWLLLSAPASDPAARLMLPNGARLAAERHAGSGTFAFELHASGGSLEDAEQHLGLADLLPRMLLRATGSPNGEDLALAAEKAGATVDAFSGPLTTGLRASGPSAAFDEVLTLAVQAALSPRLLPADLEKEKTLARQTLRTSLDDPGSALGRAARPLLFPGHPLGRVPDPEAYLDEVGIEDVRAAHAARYAGRRLTLVMAGDFEPDAALGSARRLLEATPPGETATPAPAPRAASLLRAVQRRRTTEPVLLVGFPTAGLGPDAWPAMDVLSHILIGFQERIVTEIREKRGWAYWVSGWDWRYPGVGLFAVTTAVPARRLDDAEAIVRRELARIASQAPSEAEVERARRILATSLARRRQRSAGRARTMALWETRGLPTPAAAAMRQGLRDVTPRDVRDLAARLFAAEPVVVAVR